MRKTSDTSDKLLSRKLLTGQPSTAAELFSHLPQLRSEFKEIIMVDNITEDNLLEAIETQTLKKKKKKNQPRETDTLNAIQSIAREKMSHLLNHWSFRSRKIQNTKGDGQEGYWFAEQFARRRKGNINLTEQPADTIILQCNHMEQ